MIPKGLYVRFTQAPSIYFRHTLQPLYSSINVIPCNQPLGTFLYEEVKQGN